MAGNGSFTPTFAEPKQMAGAERRRRIEQEAIIHKYEERYGVRLTEQELNSIIEEAFGRDGGISEEAAMKVKNAIERKSGKSKPRQDKPKQAKGRR